MTLDTSVEAVMRGIPGVGYEATVAKNADTLRQTSERYQRQFEETDNKGFELLGFLSGWLADTLQKTDARGRPLKESDLGVAISDRLPAIILAMPKEAKMKDGKIEYFREAILGAIHTEVFRKHPALEVMWQGVIAEIKAREIIEENGWEVLSGGESLDMAGADGIALREMGGGWQAVVYQVKSDYGLEVIGLDSDKSTEVVNGKSVRPASMLRNSLNTIEESMVDMEYTDIEYDVEKRGFTMRSKKGKEVFCRVDIVYIGIPINKAVNKAVGFNWWFGLSNGEQHNAPTYVEPAPSKDIMGPRLWKSVLADFDDKVDQL